MGCFVGEAVGCCRLLSVAVGETVAVAVGCCGLLWVAVDETLLPNAASHFKMNV